MLKRITGQAHSDSETDVDDGESGSDDDEEDSDDENTDNDDARQIDNNSIELKFDIQSYVIFFDSMTPLRCLNILGLLYQLFFSHITYVLSIFGVDYF